MLRTFEELFEKLHADGRCRSVPEGRLSQIQGEKVYRSEKEEAGRSLDWMIGYLFCLSDEGYISEEEWDNLHGILLEMVHE